MFLDVIHSLVYFIVLYYFCCFYYFCSIEALELDLAAVKLFAYQ